MEKAPERRSLYHGPLDGNDNIADLSRPLIVNCAGIVDIRTGLRPTRPAGRRDYYILLVVRGELRVTLPSGQRILRPGDLICYHPGTPYRYESAVPTSYYWLHFTGSEAPRLVEECGLTNHRILRTDRLSLLIEGFERIFEDFIARDSLFSLTSVLHLMQLLLAIAHLHHPQTAAAAPDDRIGRVIAKIHRCYNQNLTVASLAEEEFLSTGRLRELFRRRTGMSPNAYLGALRIRTAKQLLESADMTVAEAAAAVGYTDPLYFSRIFKKAVGLPPSEYRIRKGIPSDDNTKADTL